MSEDFVRDVVDYFYQTTKDEMGIIASMSYNLTGLGRFMVRPLKFFKKQDKMFSLVERFQDRKDDRGLMIHRELLKRYEIFLQARSKVEQYNIYKRKRMFKSER